MTAKIPSQEEQIIDRQFREREITVKEAEQKVNEGHLALRMKDSQRSRWGTPLVVAIFTAAAAAVGNAVVAFVNGWQGQNIERARGEAARILEMIKTDPEQASKNLKFLLDAGLIENPELAGNIRTYLAKTPEGDRAALPYPTPTPTPMPRPLLHPPSD